MKTAVYIFSAILFAIIVVFPAYFVASLKAEKKALIKVGDEVILPDENIIVRVEKKVEETGYYLMSNKKVYKTNDVLLIKPASSQIYQQRKDKMFFIYLGILLLVFLAWIWKGRRLIDYAYDFSRK